jgi:hypothetical protein
MQHRPHSRLESQLRADTTINATRAFCKERLVTQPSHPVRGTGQNTNARPLTDTVFDGVVLAHPGRLDGHPQSCHATQTIRMSAPVSL